MPIPGLTDRESAPAGLARVGKIRKGAPKNDKGYAGRALEWFRVDLDTAELNARFTDAYGERPRSFEAVLVGESVEDVFPANMEEYAGGGALHICDGSWVSGYRDPQTGGWVRPEHGTVPCPYGPEAKKRRERTKKNPGCSPKGHLRFMIPAVGWYEVWIDVGSIHDLMNVSSNLRLLEGLARDVGRQEGLAFLPVVISIVEKTISTPKAPGSAERTRRTHQLLSVTPRDRDSLLLARLADQGGMGLLGAGAPALQSPRAAAELPAPAAPNDGDWVDAGEDEVWEEDSWDGVEDEEVVVEERDVRALQRQMHAMGGQLYGIRWDAARKGLAKKVADTSSTKDFTADQYDEAIKILAEKMDPIMSASDAGDPSAMLDAAVGHIMVFAPAFAPDEFQGVSRVLQIVGADNEAAEPPLFNPWVVFKLVSRIVGKSGRAEVTDEKIAQAASEYDDAMASDDMLEAILETP